MSKPKVVKQAKRAGRPLTGAEPRKRIEMTLPQSVVDKARGIGDGNVSKGVEVAVEHFISTGSGKA